MIRILKVSENDSKKELLEEYTGLITFSNHAKSVIFRNDFYHMDISYFYSDTKSFEAAKLTALQNGFIDIRNLKTNYNEQTEKARGW